MKFFCKHPSVGVEQGTLLKCAKDIAAATQHTVACHLAKRTHRAILFCKANNLLPSNNPSLVSLSVTLAQNCLSCNSCKSSQHRGKSNADEHFYGLFYFFLVLKYHGVAKTQCLLCLSLEMVEG